VSEEPYDIIRAGGLLVLLLLVNAMLVACEISLVRLRYTLGEDEATEKLKKRWGARYLIDNAGWAAQVVRFGIMATTVGLSLAAFPLLDGIQEWIPFWKSQPGRGIIVLVLFIITASLVSFFGFLAPRGIAMKHPRRTLRSVSLLVTLLVLALYPWFKMLRKVARRFFDLVGIDFEHDFNVLDFEVQIRALADDEEPLSPLTLSIVQNALRMRELETSDVVQPRQTVHYMDLELSREENLEMARQTGHTRFPLCREDLDDCVGLIHIKDLFRWPGGLAAVDLMRAKREILSFQEDLPLEQALSQLLARKAHMALVKDEFGGVTGIITLEIIIERIIGDIHDEFDLPEAARVTTLNDEDYKVDGLTPIHEVEEAMDVEIDDTDASTFGGLVTESLGRLPESGEELTLEESGLQVRIEAVDEKRILSATVKKLQQDEDDD
ncbi:MAG: CNNM domain-containing protein, partial [Puniceicoccales bacterium]